MGKYEWSMYFMSLVTLKAQYRVLAKRYSYRNVEPIAVCPLVNFRNDGSVHLCITNELD
jgi:hypothetical protein